MRRAAIVLMLGLALSSCALTRSPADRIQQLKPGMTQDQVRAIMGAPYNMTVVGNQELWMWAWPSRYGNSTGHAATFIDGRLIEEPPPRRRAP